MADDVGSHGSRPPTLESTDVTISRSSTSSLWADAVDAAETMTAWHRRRVRDVDEGCWSDVVQLLALALWHVATDQNVTVGDAALHGEVFGYLRAPERLLAEPLPGQARPPDLHGPFDPVLQRADRVMDHNHGQYSPGRGLGNTRDGLRDPFTVDHRLAEIAQDPEGLPPLPETGRLRDAGEAIGIALNRRRWRPSDQELRVADTAHGAVSRLGPPDSEADPFDQSWLARLRRMARVGDMVRSVPSSSTAVSPLLTELAAAIASLVVAVTEPLPRLEEAWSAQPKGQRVPVWERAHLPLQVRSRVHDAEHELLVTSSTLTACVTGDVDY